MSKHSWRTQWHDIPGASNFHNRVKEIFRSNLPFKNFKCYQEVAVSDINPEYSKTNEHFDWYIEELNLVIELHGKQHYQVVNYGNTDGDKAQRDLYRMQERDSNKQRAATEAGCAYLAIPHWEKLTPEKLLELVMEAQ